MKIVLTGGGTAGHVMPHLAMLSSYEKRHWQVFYIGTEGIEKKLVSEAGIPFYTIRAGKLRRYLSFKNLVDVFKIFWGFVQSIFILAKLRPALVFSKGGFVSVPVAYAAWVLRIPVLTHESDVTPGLANKLMIPVSRHIFYTFQKTQKYLPEFKSVLVGLPIRSDLDLGNRQKGYEFCGFCADDPRKVVLVIGGSQGAQVINNVVAESMQKLCKDYLVVHLTGKGKSIQGAVDGYKGFEFVSEELKDLLAIADVAVARSGANSIFELLFMQIPMLLIPLVQGSRGDQLHNAQAFEEVGYAKVLLEKDLNSETFLSKISDLIANKHAIKGLMAQNKQLDSCAMILAKIEEFSDI